MPMEILGQNDLKPKNKTAILAHSVFSAAKMAATGEWNSFHPAHSPLPSAHSPLPSAHSPLPIALSPIPIAPKPV